MEWVGWILNYKILIDSQSPSVLILFQDYIIYDYESFRSPVVYGDQ